ncbi:hypothetical protein ACBP95_18670 [Morganella morganii]|uniref:hypothetical protein n=1 Tax=Morganella morganii TaxID=582 RepID=UPI0035265367
MGLNNDCSVRKKYTDIYIDSFNEVIDLYESEGVIPKGMLKLTSINDHVLDEWFKSWYGRSNRFKHGNWHWDRMIAKRRKKCKRFDLAIWSGEVLCGLTLGGVSRGNKTVRIDYIEANPNKHPLDKKIAGIAIAVAISVGQKINASHVAIFNPVNDKVESLYRKFGFQRMSLYGRFLKNVMYLEVPSPN